MQASFAQRQLETRMIRQALRDAQGDVVRASLELRLSRRTLLKKMGEYNIHQKDFLPKKKKKRRYQ